uniref:Uncharacterized protein n=1 Tax=Cacopsylla melanoneura TaxID=428564 RepID=A0A8D8U5T5_9HEMI
MLPTNLGGGGGAKNKIYSRYSYRAVARIFFFGGGGGGGGSLCSNSSFLCKMSGLGGGNFWCVWQESAWQDRGWSWSRDWFWGWGWWWGWCPETPGASLV